MRGPNWQTVATVTFSALTISTAGLAADAKKGDFLQDYITCGTWAQSEKTDTELHAAIGKWMVDYLRRHSPSGLEALPDKEIRNIVERQCSVQADRSLSVAVFLSGTLLPD